MNKIIQTEKKTVIFLASLSALLSLFLPLPIPISVFTAIVYFSIVGYFFGDKLLPDQEFFWKYLFGIVSVTSLITTILSVIYWFYQINSNIIAAVMIVLSIIALSFSQKSKLTFNFKKAIDLFQSLKQIKLKNFNNLLILATTAGEFYLIYKLIINRSGQTIISPWIQIGNNFLLIFLGVSIILFYTLQKDIHKYAKSALAFLYYFIFLNIALIIYSHGFGFDPFIHQATEKWIAENGSIIPKKPYYIGQYMLIVMSHLITGLKISLLDKALVPMLSTALIPTTTFFVFKDKINSTYLYTIITLLPIFAFSTFIVTTPNNLALLFAFLVILWTWYEYNNPKDYKKSIVGGIMSLMTATVHPLIGIPVVIFYSASILFRYTEYKKIWHKIIYFITLVSALPVTLISYLYLNNAIQISNPFNKLDVFLRIFNYPHWYRFDEASTLWRLFYQFNQWIFIPALVLFCLFGFWSFYKTNEKKEQVAFYLTTTIALFISAFILATTINISNVISYESESYGRRLVDLSLFLFIPGFVYGVRKIFTTKVKRYKTILTTIFAILLTNALYFTYPTRDAVSKYTGYNVRSADIEAVRFIDNKNDNKEYIVLSNQMIGAAALHEFGFAKYHKLKNSEQYFYSIPTGAPLYKYFRKMVYEKPKRKWVKQAMNFAGVDKVYFVHTNYWYPAAKIRDQAKKDADKWWEFGNGQVWVYEYKKEPAD